MTLIPQKVSGLKFCTRRYRSTTKPNVGNWHDPAENQTKCTLAERRNLTIADDLLLQDCHHSLKLKGLQTSKSRTNPQIKFDSGSHGVCLPFVELYWLPSSTEHMSGSPKALSQKFGTIPMQTLTYALSVLLNLARLTSIRALPFLAWLRTSEPMCSPSLSQSVQINSALLYLAWFRIFSAIGSFSCEGC